MKLINREQIAGMNIHYLFYSLDYFLDKQAELGFKTIELWGGAPHFYLDSMGYQDAKEVRKKIESRGLQVKVFTPENVMYQYQMAAQTPELFEKSFQYFKNGLQVASELGCKIMQTNSGWGYWDEDREEAWKRSREMISKLADEAGKLGMSATVGYAASTINPFCVLVAQGIAGIQGNPQLVFRMIQWVIMMAIIIAFTTIRAMKVKKNPQS